MLINYELLKSGYVPIVIPQEKKAEYFSYIADMNINGLTNFIKELELSEIGRMKSFVEMEKSITAKMELNKTILELEKKIGNTIEINHGKENERD